MTYTTKPDAMRLAAALDAGENFYAESSMWFDMKLAQAVAEAAAELRRLHAENEALREMSFDTKRSQADTALAEPQACEWHQEDEDTGTWASGCGELWSFIDGGPAENRVRFCHGCGRVVSIAHGITKDGA